MSFWEGSSNSFSYLVLDFTCIEEVPPLKFLGSLIQRANLQEMNYLWANLEKEGFQTAKNKTHCEKSQAPGIGFPVSTPQLSYSSQDMEEWIPSKKEKTESPRETGLHSWKLMP